MISIFLRLLLIFGLWWVVLWLVLPVEWLQGGLPSFIAWHLVPPLLGVAAWKLSRRGWAWHVARTQKAHIDRKSAEQARQQKIEQAARQEKLMRRRAHIECRGAWVTLSKIPDWAKENYAEYYDVFEENIDEIKKAGRAAALSASLEQVLGAALGRSEALIWLPVILAHEGIPVDEVEKAWKQVAESNYIELPPSLDCQPLPGAGNVADRLIDLFENDPSVPAVLVLGMDSPLTDAPKEPGAGHVALALLFGRPGLDEAEIGKTDFVPQTGSDDPYAPYWERNPHADTGAIQWRRIPPQLRQAFLWRCPRMATLHKSSNLMNPATERRRAEVQQMRRAIHDALVQAGICDETSVEISPNELPEIGWLVHDSPNANCFVTLAMTCANGDGRPDPVAEASKVQDEFGNVGVAREALMLAVAVLRATQLDKPVLLAGFGKGEEAHFGVSKPCDFGRSDVDEHWADEPEEIEQG
jgi:hypothetical protein